MKTWRAQLTATPWATLDHAYGQATDVPKLIRRLTKAATAENAAHALWAAVLHQGSIYSATAPAMKAIAHLLTAGDAAMPALTAWLLRNFAAAVQNYSGVDEAAEAQAVADGEAAAVATLHACRAALVEIAQLLQPQLAPRNADIAAQATPTDDINAVAEVAALLQVFALQQDAAIASLLARVTHQPAGSVEQACMATLVYLGADPDLQLSDAGTGDMNAPEAPATLALHLAAALARVAQGGTRPIDVQLLSNHWPQAIEFALHTVIQLQDADDVGPWLASVNATAATQIFAAQPGSDAETIDALVDVVRSSRSNTPQAVQRLLAIAAQPQADADLLIGALRQVPATPQICDAIFHLASRVSQGRRVQRGSSEVNVDARADAALALLRAGDERWHQPMVQMLLSNSAARAIGVADSAHSSMALGYAMQREQAKGNEALASGLRQALRQAPPADKARDGAGSLLDWLATWPPELIQPVLPEVHTLLARFPGPAAGVIAAAGDHKHLPALRALSPEQGKVQVMLAIARLSAEVNDFHAVLDETDKQYEEDAILRFGESHADDARFLVWCQGLVGTAMATSHPGRGYQLRAMAILAQQDASNAARHWPVLRAIVNDGGGPLAEALALAFDWLGKHWLGSEQNADLQALLADIVVTGRKSWNGPRPEASAQAALALHQFYGDTQPLPGTPARLTRIVMACLGDDRWSHALGLRLAAICVAGTAPAPLRKALSKPLKALLEQDSRPSTTGDPAIIDEALRAGLRQVLES